MIQAPEGEKPYLNPYISGVGIGTILFLSFFLIGKGLGGSGSLTRLLAFSLDTVAPKYTATVDYFSRYLTGTVHPLDNWLVYMLIGVVTGGLIDAISGKRTKKIIMLKGDHTTNKRRTLTAFLGGILVALGARLAGGCTSGLAITGSSVLAVAGWVFFLSVFAAGLIVAFFMRKEWL
ncbi:MAG: YeeE/YedE family protein [SAR324 cluster bacterium]|nr:YeeE/YedE family protein [SAR324 cluster bacterium]